MARKILCVAEKPAIAKSVAQHLSGGAFTTVSLSSYYQIYPRVVTEHSCSEIYQGIGLLRTMILPFPLDLPGASARSP